MKTFFGVLISIIFIPIFIILVIFYSLSTSIINEKELPKTLAHYRSYETITEKILPKFLQTFVSQNLNDQEQQVVANITEKINKVVTPQWLETNFTQTYSSIISYIKGDSDQINVQIDLNEISQIFSSDEIVSTFISTQELEKQFLALPICTSDMKSNCRAADLTFENYQKLLSTSINQNQDIKSLDIPKTINIYDLLNTQNGILDNIKNIYSLSMTISYIIIGFEILLILLLIITFLNEPKRLFKFLGINFLIIGIILAITSLIPISSTSVVGIILPANIIPNIFAADLLSIISDIIKSFFTKILLISIILVIISIVFFIISKKIKPILIYKNKISSS